METQLLEPLNGSVEVAPRPSVNLMGTDDPVAVIERSSRVATALGELILRRSLYTEIHGKKYVHLDGWQVAGTMLGVVAVVTATEEIEQGWKATAEARTLDGRVIGAAESICTRDEKRGPWKNAEGYALIAMAQTRAMSRALRGPLGFILKLSGYESTTAEDAETIEPPQQVPDERGVIPAEVADELFALYEKSPHKADALKMKLASIGASDTSSAKAAIYSLADGQQDEARAWIMEG